MIRRIALCYLFLAAVLLIQAEAAQREEASVAAEFQQ